jgi:hypothetical protein
MAILIFLYDPIIPPSMPSFYLRVPTANKRYRTAIRQLPLSPQTLQHMQFWTSVYSVLPAFSTCDRVCSFFQSIRYFRAPFLSGAVSARVRSFRRPTGKPSRSSGMPRCRHSSESSTRKVKTLLSHEVSSRASNVMPRLRGPMRVHAYVQRSATFWRSSALKARCND